MRAKPRGVTHISTKILISACLLGEAVRYDGHANLLDHKLISQWSENGQLIKLCPEVAAGLTIPRQPAEIQNGNGIDVLNGTRNVSLKSGRTITTAFIRGAELALSLAKKHHISFALLKANSPSCGNEAIYNGHFTGTLQSGSGVTAALLEANGIQVFNEHQLEALELSIKTFKHNLFI